MKKEFKPIVLVQLRESGFVNMFTRRYWDSIKDRKNQPLRAIAFGDTPEESAKLWEVREDMNRAIRNARDA